MRVDVIEQIGAVVRQVRSAQRDGKAAKVVVASRTYATHIEDLWNAITDPERLRRWFTPVSGELHLGGRYQLEGNAGGIITACEPPKALALTWEFGSEISWVDVRLTPQSRDRTRLELEHTEILGESWERFGPGAGGVGWELGLLGLNQLLIDGRTVDPVAWPASDEGKDFMSRSAEAWGDADVASGAEASVARAAALRIAAFYRGEGDEGHAEPR
jgi:uncharacterized protein YndB with AHSA1/START domain